MSKSKLIEQSWKNSIEQVLSPGDPVVVIASGYSHSVNVRKGVFLGTVNGDPCVVSDHRMFGYWLNGKNVGYENHDKPGVKSGYGVVKRKSTLPAGRVFKVAV